MTELEGLRWLETTSRQLNCQVSCTFGLGLGPAPGRCWRAVVWHQGSPLHAATGHTLAAAIVDLRALVEQAVAG